MSAYSILRNMLTSVGVDTRALYQKVSASSIRSALVEQNLADLCDRLREIVPDVIDQYTQDLDKVEFDRYWETKMRGLHAFQTSCALEAIKHLDRQGNMVRVFGDHTLNAKFFRVFLVIFI